VKNNFSIFVNIEMENCMENVFAKKLKSARLLSGLSLRKLAEKITIDLSAQALNLYEKGERKPDSSIIIALSEALQVPIDYFFRDSNIKLGNVEFRKKSKLGKKDIQQIKEFVIDYDEKMADNLIAGFEKLKKQIQTNEAPQALADWPRNWQCSYCQYKEICRLAAPAKLCWDEFKDKVMQA